MTSDFESTQRSARKPIRQLGKYKHDLILFYKVLSQTQKGSNKNYSLHESDVRCIAKAKEAKKDEFGNKVSIVKTMQSGIIVGALSFKENRWVFRI